MTSECNNNADTLLMTQRSSKVGQAHIDTVLSMPMNMITALL